MDEQEQTEAVEQETAVNTEAGNAVEPSTEEVNEKIGEAVTEDQEAAV